MKNQVSPPVLTTSPPVALANARCRRSSGPCRRARLAGEVRGAGAGNQKHLVLVARDFLTARATLEVGTSTITSTPSLSNHCGRWLEPISGLFWWSALISSIFLPATVPPKSAMAMRAASTEPCPLMSA